LQVNRTTNPIVFNLDNDPGEKYPITSGVRYKAAKALINPYLENHRQTMVRGMAQNIKLIREILI
jgi:hypothetical protein